MYRNSVDNTIRYTAGDIVLFRESPFAAWMERLTLENPDHGIPPDRNTSPPSDLPAPQDEIVATLRAEGRNVAQIERDQEEPARRTATLEAMRSGADFIVHGQLTVGALSGRSSLLMRTSGYSNLGDFLYIPCETESANTLQPTFRLCFHAELLQQLQGQLPPQLLLIRDGAEVVPLQTDDHIHYFRAVLRRFLQAMATFRKHRMPDPAESSHFGRWTECASEVIKQRANSELRRAEEQPEDVLPEVKADDDGIILPPLKVANGAVPASIQEGAFAEQRVIGSFRAGSAVLTATAASQPAASHTLAEQARMLEPGRFQVSAPTGHTPNLAGYTRPQAVPPGANSRQAGHNRRSSDAALENLAFIGSSPGGMAGNLEPVSHSALNAPSAPAPSLREGVKPGISIVDADYSPGASRLPDLEPKAPIFLPPDQGTPSAPPDERLKPHPRASDNLKKREAGSVIDLDSAPPPSLAPVVQRAEAEFERLIREDPIFRNADRNKPKVMTEHEPPPLNPFSDSLMTSGDYTEH